MNKETFEALKRIIDVVGKMTWHAKQDEIDINLIEQWIKKSKWVLNE